MELVYLWVEDYKNIKKQGFNFSPKFHCDFKDEYDTDGKLKDNCELIIKENDDYIPDFFGKNINITAIVGKNGSGKSSIFELISFLRFERIKRITYKKVLLVFENKNTLFIICNSDYTHNFSCDIEIINKTHFAIQNQNISSNELFELTMFTNGLTDFTMQDDSHYLMRTSHFYSFYNGEHIHYKITSDDKQMHHELNAKYASLLKIDDNFFEILGEKFLFNKMHVEIDFLKKNELSTYDDNYVDSFKKINMFYNSDFGVIEEITLGSDNNKIESKDDKKIELIYKFLSFYFLKLYIDLVTRFERDFKENFKKDFFEKYIEYILIPLNMKETKNAEIVVYTAILTITRQYYQKIDKLFKSVFKDKEGMFDDYIVHQKELVYLKKFPNLVSIINKNFEFQDYDKNSFELVSKFVPIDQEKINYFYKNIDRNYFLQDLYSSGLVRLNFYNEKGYDYRKLSTGEKQLLNFFVGFSYTLSIMSYTNKSVIFMEEIEISMHPEWQRKIFNIILKIFERLQSLNKINQTNKYHLFYTTHSPFLLSDIPKQNIIFLDTYKKENIEVKQRKQKIGNCKVVDGLKEKKETFGANIHTLLSDGFFMEDGLMGEFAKNKIDEIIKNLNNKDYDPERKEKENILLVIKSIGEPFLKNKILDMYYKKFNDVYLIEARKKELLEEQAKIETELKKYD